MNHVRRIAYLIRHIKNFLPYVTARKLVNAAINVSEQKLKVATPRSTPPYLKVEPTPLCQLACPGCAHGTSDLKARLRNDMHMDINTFKAIVDPLADRLLGVSLSLRGEPLLGKDLIEMIKYTHSKSIAVSFPTNFSLNLRDKQIEELVLSGLDSIYVSLDGATRDTYGRYRVGGNFDLVLKNVKRLSTAKRKYGLKRPNIIWKFIIFDHNRHEKDTVKKIYKELGFDSYELQANGQGKSESARKRAYLKKIKEKKIGCYWAWNSAVVRADGEVMACCQRIHSDFQLGNVFEQNLTEIWKSGRFSSLRKGFETMSDADLHEVCARCLDSLPEGPQPAATRSKPISASAAALE